VTAPAVLTTVSYQNSPRAVGNKTDYYGRLSVDLIGPPRRLYGDGALAPPLLEPYVDALRVRRQATPAELLGSLPDGDSWLAQSSRSLARLHALFLIAEDPQGRLVGRTAATLAHQASLVKHVLEAPTLRRVLIADEVGLGKTIEAGLIIQSLLDQNPGMRVLYLAPARLVSNVYREFREKLDLYFRQFSADDVAQADMASDPLVVASIHKAVHPANRDRVAAATPWDVLVVDECHHLSARGPNGTDANEQYDLVRALIKRQPPGARVILLSGTPHQGQRARFDNLLGLLREEREGRDALRGRVIFRTKEDVRDWKGRPVFPKRDVRPPHVVKLGGAYERWYENIGELYDGTRSGDAAQRAAAWAKGQALQWAASSVQAGLGFLVRLAVRRLKLTLENRPFREALAAMRPYRSGAPDEPLPALYQRIVNEVSRQLREDDTSDMEEMESEPWRPNARHLDELLEQGVALLRSPAATAKWQKLLDLLAETPHEKAVLFAQPVETVDALSRFLAERLGEQPARIVGGQSEADREAQIQAFRRTDGPRLLVSSRAGGEGINLQVSRRLIHVDVPWNPMDMEQRVGRVHRFGSLRTILVDTIVVEGTREVDAYRVAREKLRVAFGDLSNDPERFEALFSRVMSLIPPQQFEELLGGAAPGPITAADSEKLGELVAQGLRRWQEFHTEFASQKNAISELNPGHATWDDLRAFMTERAGAEPVEGYSVPEFGSVDGEVVTTLSDITALRVDGQVYSCGDTAGMRASGADGVTVPPLGLNVPVVASRLRTVAFPDQPTGAAWLRLPAGAAPALAGPVGSSPSNAVGVLAFLRQLIRVGNGTAAEQDLELRVLIVHETGEAVEVGAKERGTVVRALLSATRQREPQGVSGWSERMARAEAEWLPAVGRPSDAEFGNGTRPAVWPILAAVVTE
jgi:superfamily II DNA or RNA helicase